MFPSGGTARLSSSMFVTMHGTVRSGLLDLPHTGKNE